MKAFFTHILLPDMLYHQPIDQSIQCLQSSVVRNFFCFGAKNEKSNSDKTDTNLSFCHSIEIFRCFEVNWNLSNWSIGWGDHKL